MRKEKELDDTQSIDLACELSNVDVVKLFPKCNQNICFSLCLIVDTDKFKSIGDSKFQSLKT